MSRTKPKREVFEQEVYPMSPDGELPFIVAPRITKFQVGDRVRVTVEKLPVRKRRERKP